MAVPQWKLNLQPASYNGVGFFVNVGSRVGGRRIINHEYPKRDTPYAEDMGRKSRRFTVTGYVIGPNYTDDRDVLISELELEGPGTLVLPTGLERVGTSRVTIENFGVTERVERGGEAVFEMSFMEAGVNTSTISVSDTAGAVSKNVDSAVGSTSDPSSFFSSSDFD